MLVAALQVLEMIADTPHSTPSFDDGTEQKWLHDAHPLTGSKPRAVRNAEWFHVLNGDGFTVVREQIGGRR